MAVRACTRLGTRGTRYAVYQWTGLLNTDTGAPLWLEDFNDLTFKSSGNYSGGAAVTMLGAMNLPGETTDAGSVLEEEAGVDLVLNAASPWATSRNAPLMVWPSVTTGDGSTSLTVRAVVRR